MDQETRNSLARIAVEWHKSAAKRVGQTDEVARRRAVNESTAMSPIALRHRRYTQLIQFRRKAG